MKFSWIILPVFFHLGAAAQPYFDVANIQYQLSPDASLYGKNRTPLEIRNLSAGINLPVKVFKSDVILLNPSFEYNGLDLHHGVSHDHDLYGASFALSYVKQWKKPEWKTVLVSVNRINSHLQQVTVNHYQPGGAVLMIYERSKKIRYKLGIYYNAEFFGAFVLPLAGVDWMISDRLILHGIVPRNLTLEYKLTPFLYVGAGWKAVTSSYRYASAHPHDYIKIEENQFRLFTDIYASNRIVCNFEAGHSLLRKYNKRSEAQRLAGFSSNLGVNEGWLIKVGLYYRVRLDREVKPR